MSRSCWEFILRLLRLSVFKMASLVSGCIEIPQLPKSVIILLVYEISLLLIGDCDAKPKNFALNQDAFQSSTRNPRGEARRAVDGNSWRTAFSGYEDENSVTHTNPDMPAWWMVDLGQAQYITSIQITNRDAGGYRLANFTVETSLDDPRLLAGFPGKTAAHDCITVNGNIGDGKTVLYSCQTSMLAQYLRLVKYNEVEDNRALSICEFEAYDVREWAFGRPLESTNSPDIFKTILNLRSKLDCARACAQNTGPKLCKAVQFHTPTGNCQLLGSIQVDLSGNAEWEFYAIKQ